MLISPSGLPQIRLSYIRTNDDGTITEKSEEDGATYAYLPYPNCLIFDIDDLGVRKEIKYDIANDVIIDDDTYAMMNFDLLKFRNGRLFYVGTLLKTDLEEGSCNIKITGELHEQEFKTLPHLTSPEM